MRGYGKSLTELACDMKKQNLGALSVGISETCVCSPAVLTNSQISDISLEARYQHVATRFSLGLVGQ